MGKPTLKGCLIFYSKIFIYYLYLFNIDLYLFKLQKYCVFNLPVYYFLPQKKINEFLILLPLKGICRYMQKGNDSAKNTEKEKLYLEQVIARATFQNF